MTFSPEFSNIECTANQLTEETAAQRFDPKNFFIMECMLEPSIMGYTIWENSTIIRGNLTLKYISHNAQLSHIKIWASALQAVSLPNAMASWLCQFNNIGKVKKHLNIEC